MRRLLAVAWVIARRDYVAAVWSRLFVLFLALPLVLGAIGGVFGAIGARQDAPPPRATIAVAPALYPMVAAARARLVAGLGEGAVPPIVTGSDFRDDAAAVIEGTPDRPQVRVAADAPPGTADAAALLVERRDPGRASTAIIRHTASPAEITRSGSTRVTGVGLARGVQYAILILTIMLSGRLLSSFVEERSNKSIEILAAAAPVDAIFFGKLIGMLLFALTAVFAWGMVAGVVGLATAPGAFAALPVPAIGWIAFVPLALGYFAASFLLFGAVMLGMGAQAATPGDIQTLALPTTVAQLLLFGLASVAVADPSGRIAIVAAALPWSSPLAMAARAAERPEYWPHLLAIVWQIGWIALTVRIAAGLFRRSVLKSGPRRK